jgi:hypothetical protein
MAVINYDQYAALKSKVIWRTITAKELQQLREFEAKQPQTCPECGANVHGFIIKTEIVHDVTNCPHKKKPKE